MSTSRGRTRAGCAEPTRCCFAGRAVEGRDLPPGGRLREDFEVWGQRNLAEHGIRCVFLDGWCPRVRIGKNRVRVPGSLIQRCN